MAGLAKAIDLPSVFKAVTYPQGGISGASPEGQQRFFREILESLRDPQQGLSVLVKVAAQGEFDTPWKRRHPFFAWDPYCGLLNDDGTLRPAASPKF